MRTEPSPIQREEDRLVGIEEQLKDCRDELLAVNQLAKAWREMARTLKQALVRQVPFANEHLQIKDSAVIAYNTLAEKEDKR